MLVNATAFNADTSPFGPLRVAILEGRLVNNPPGPQDGHVIEKTLAACLGYGDRRALVEGTSKQPMPVNERAVSALCG